MSRLFALCLFLALLCGCAASTPVDVQIPNPGIESLPHLPEATATFTPTLTSTLTDTPTVTNTLTFTDTPVPTETPTPQWQLPLTTDINGNQVFDFSKVDQFPHINGLDQASINGFLAFLEDPRTGLVKPFPSDVTKIKWIHKQDERFDILYLSQSMSTSVDNRPARNIAAVIPKFSKSRI